MDFADPPQTLRVAVDRITWPLRPELARTRDELSLVRTLYAPPLRVGRDGKVAPSLCTAWSHRRYVRWTLVCRRGDAIARQLRRAAHAHPLLRAARIRGTRGGLSVRLRGPWARFPYFLTTAAASPPEAARGFRVTRPRPGTLVLARPRQRIVFRALPPSRAALLFGRGLLDDVPIPFGEIRAAQLDPLRAPHVRVTPLRGVDAVVVDVRSPLANLPNTRRAYWQTAARADYQALVTERQAEAAVTLLSGEQPDRAPAAAFRAARAQVPSLPPIPVGIAAERGLGDARDLLVAAWRDVGLLARPDGEDATLRRLLAAYPQDEALLATVFLPLRGLAGQGAFLAALGRRDQAGLLRHADASLFATAMVVPLARAVDARLVSPRARGWRADFQGAVDYSNVFVRSRA